MEENGFELSLAELGAVLRLMADGRSNCIILKVLFVSNRHDEDPDSCRPPSRDKNSNIRYCPIKLSMLPAEL